MYCVQCGKKAADGEKRGAGCNMRLVTARRLTRLLQEDEALLIMIPFMALAAVGRPGMMYVLRNWARDEHSFMMQDYKEAIKTNWRQALPIGIFNGLSFFLTFVAYVTYGQMAENSWFFNIPQALMVVLLAVWWMANELMFPMMITYKMRLRDIVRNSVIISIARLPFAFLILLGTVAVPLAILLLLVPLPFSILVLLVVYGLIGFAFAGFVQASFANSCFDRFQKGSLHGRGLRRDLLRGYAFLASVPDGRQDRHRHQCPRARRGTQGVPGPELRLRPLQRHLARRPHEAGLFRGGRHRQHPSGR